MLLRKNERFLYKKTVPLKDFSSSESKSSKKKESFQDKVSEAKFSYQILPLILCKVT